MPITAITLTGDRPATFALTERWASRQTLQPDQWIVCDDGLTPTVCTMGQEYVRRERQPLEPAHTLPLQLLAVLPLVRHDRVAFYEDDDWYAPRFTATANRWLDTHAMAGEGWAVYCHPRNQWFKVHQNSEHCSLAATVFRMEEVGWLFEQLCRTARGPCVDSSAWAQYQGRKRVYPNEGLVTQLKGGPGRAGTLPSHYDSRHYVQDTGDAVLRARLGADAEDVLRVFRGG